MSEPMAKLGHRPESLAAAAMMDLVSAGSALNMEPSPIKPEDPGYDEEDIFLADTDHWAKHSMVHNHAALMAVDCLRSMIDHIRMYLEMNRAGAWEPMSPKVFTKIEQQAIDRYMDRMKEG